MIVSTKPHSFFLLISGNHHNVLCTATLVSIRVLFSKFTALRILMTRNTHNKWNMMIFFFKK